MDLGRRAGYPLPATNMSVGTNLGAVAPLKRRTADRRCGAILLLALPESADDPGSRHLLGGKTADHHDTEAECITESARIWAKG